MIRSLGMIIILMAIASCSAPNSVSAPGIEPRTHVVNEGETLASIAAQYGLEPHTLLQSNGNSLMDAPGNLKVGVELLIPPEDGALYRWYEGDKLDTVADFFGVDVAAIVNYEGNNLDGRGPSSDGVIDIPPGTLIFIPGGERPLTNFDPGAAEGAMIEECKLWYPTLPPRCMAPPGESRE